MPTTYAHDSFGRIVLKALPEEMQTLIHKYISLYRIGLHGPDILFYYGLSKNYVNQTGVRLHGEIAYPFFQKGIERAKKDKDEALLVYLLGFGCHFMLDSTCHPYVYEIAPQVGHTLIEKEMDRSLMEKDGKNPLTYFPAKGIIPGDDICAVIAKMFQDISPAQIKRVLKGMRRSTGLMIYQDEFRYNMVMAVLKIAGKYDELGDHFMTKSPAGGLENHLSILEDLYRRAIDETPVILEGIYRSAKTEDTLPERLRRNYKK